MGGGGGRLPGQYIGWWGDMGSMPQKGTVSYALSPNRQRPLAGALRNAFFNTFRRSSGQVLYIVPPILAGYYLMHWATERNEYLNSKAGRAEFADEE